MKILVTGEQDIGSHTVAEIQAKRLSVSSGR